MKCCSSKTSAILALKPFISAEDSSSHRAAAASRPPLPHKALSLLLRAAKDGADRRQDCRAKRKQTGRVGWWMRAVRSCRRWCLGGAFAGIWMSEISHKYVKNFGRARECAILVGKLSTTNNGVKS